MKKLLCACIVVALVIMLLPIYTVTASADGDWKVLVKDYFFNSNIEEAVAYLEPISKTDKEAKIMRAALLANIANPEEDYRKIVAELVDEGYDVAPLLQNVTKEVLGFNINLDLNGMMLYAYCSGDYSTAFSLATYQARRGSLFGKTFLGYALIHCIDNGKQASRIGIDLEEIENGLKESVAAGDPVAMYVLAELYTFMGHESEVNYYRESARLLNDVEEAGSIPYPKSIEDDGPDSLNKLSGLDFSVRNPLCCFFIGECYRFGDGDSSVDYDEAAHWYLKAFEMFGLPEAAQNYGHILLGKILKNEVLDDERDEVFRESAYYIEYAAKTCRKVAAQYDLAFVYYMINDLETGDYWMKTSAENGFYPAQNYVQGSYQFEDWMPQTGS